MHRTTTALLRWLLLLASVHLSVVAFAQDTLESLPTSFEGPDGFEQSRVEAWKLALHAVATRAAPRIEAIAGRRFGTLPSVLPVDKKQLTTLIGDEAASGHLFGLYLHSNDTVYVPIEPQVAHTQGSGLPTPLLGGMLELIVVHELTHALQARIRMAADQPARSRAGYDLVVLEGHAHWVTYKYAEHHDLGESWGYARMLQEPSGPASWSDEMIPYGLGLRLMLDAPDNDARIAALLNPPPTEKAEQALQFQLDLSAGVLEGLSGAIGDADWGSYLSGREAPNPVSLFRDLPPGFWAALGHVDRAATLDLGGSIHGRAAAIIFDEAGWARSLVEKRMEVHGEPYWIRAMNLDKTLTTPGIRYASTPITDPRFDAAGVVEFKVYQRQPGAAWWVARGHHLLVFELLRSDKEADLPAYSAVAKAAAALLDTLGAERHEATVPWPQTRRGDGLRDVPADVLDRLSLSDEWRTQAASFEGVHALFRNLDYTVVGSPVSAWGASAEREDEVVMVVALDYGDAQRAQVVLAAIRQSHRQLKRGASQYDVNFFSRSRRWTGAIKKDQADDGVTHLRAHREDTTRVYALRKGQRVLLVAARRAGMSDGRVLKAIRASTWGEASR